MAKIDWSRCHQCPIHISLHLFTIFIYDDSPHAFTPTASGHVSVSTHIVCRKKELEELRKLCLSWVAVFIQRLMEMDYKIH